MNLKRMEKDQSKKLMIEMISLYLDQTTPLIRAMKQGLQDKDCDLLNSAVHKMIPSFSIMGISADFENMAKKVQDLTSKKEFTNEIQDLVKQLEDICTQACEESEEELKIIKKI